MCGIAGISSADPSARSAAVVAGMLGRLAHRGPDDEGIIEHGTATLGVRRLAIIDLVSGHQPMTNEDGSVSVIQNGEIYNFRELRADLDKTGHRFRTQSDTEVLAHAYEEWGADFVSHLRGMFALAVWDERRRSLVLARDRFGKKPLVYAELPGGIAFASELQGLLAHPDVARDVDPSAIDDYLVLGYIPSPRTAFARIRKLDPAHVLVFTDGRVSMRRYWQLHYEPKREISFDDAADELRSRIDDAVRMRLISDVPLGAFLSGGLDSSTVVAFMARHSERPVKTFSVDFRDSDFSEAEHARRVARAFGTDHQELTVDAAEADVLPLIVRHLGEPMADSSIIPTYHVARITRSAVTVALNGDGGDEIFGGYAHYRFAAVADRVAGTMPGPVAAGVGGLAERLPRSTRLPRWYRRGRRFATALPLSTAERYLRWLGYFVGPLHDDVAGPQLRTAERPQAELVRWAVHSTGAASPIDRYLAADSMLGLPGDLLVKMDIATMANSLEARSPLLDHELAEFMACLPSSFKVRAGRTKLLLRHAMREVLPAETLGRGKMGFSAPVARWFRGPLRDLFADTVLSTRARERGFIRTATARRIFEDHLAARDSRPNLLWNLLMLELWSREYLDQAPAGATGDARHTTAPRA